MKIKKGAIEFEVLVWWIIGIIILILIIIGYFILSGKGNYLIEHIKNIFRFGK